MNAQDWNAPAVSIASIAAGAVTALEFLPPVIGAASSIGGLVLLFFLVKHKMIQIKISALELEDKENEHK